LHKLKHISGVKSAIAKIGVFPNLYFKLSTTLRELNVDAAGFQSVQTILALTSVQELQKPFSSSETFSYEGEKNCILLLVRIEESADMTRALNARPCNVHRIARAAARV
jgi:hypothetical protein